MHYIDIIYIYKFKCVVLLFYEMCVGVVCCRVLFNWIEELCTVYIQYTVCGGSVYCGWM